MYLNYPDVVWYSNGIGCAFPRENVVANLAYEFTNILGDLSLCQCVDEPTFIKASGEETNILDLIISESRFRIDEVKYDPPLGDRMQGHKTISFGITTARNSNIGPKFDSRKYNFSKGD